MRPPSIVLWCYIFLLVASSSESLEHSTKDDEQTDNSTVRNDLLVNSTRDRGDEMEPTQYNLHENSTKNNDQVQYESRINSTKNDRKDDNSVWYKTRGYIMKNCQESNNQSRANSTEVNDKNDSMLQEINESLTKTERESNSTSCELYGNSNTNNYNNNMTTIHIVKNKACDSSTCIQLCCPFGDRLSVQGNCVPDHFNGSFSFPNVYKYYNDSEDKTLNELFRLTVRDPCLLQEVGRDLLPHNYYFVLDNGTLYRGPGQLIPPTSYCLAVLNGKIYDVIICNSKMKLPIYISVCLLVSLPFFLLTFLVYSILPELQNMHSYTLRAHIASLFVTYIIMAISQQIPEVLTYSSSCCISIAYIFNFLFLSSFFWLNVTCFDIWWTFRGVRSYRTNIRHHEKKKFVIYSIYAWGAAFICTIICAIMDYASVPENWIRPEMCKTKFWFNQDIAKTIYFFIPMGATVISNICFFIATTLTILYQKKRTAQQLKDSESKRHDENKQRFGMYLKLFIIMGITWVMEILAWSFGADFLPPIVWYPTDTLNALQGLIIFIIFVCTKKILRLLLKRFGCQNRCTFLTNDDGPSTATSLVSGSGSGSGSGTVSMQEISSSNQQTNHRAQSN